MWEDFCGWIHHHTNIVLAFVVGLSFGIFVLAFAYFSTRNENAARALRIGAQFTGNPDIGEDLVWFFCGIVVGASITWLAWWRDSKAQSMGLEKEDVLNRLFTEPTPPVDRKPENSRQRPSPQIGPRRIEAFQTSRDEGSENQNGMQFPRKQAQSDR